MQKLDFTEAVDKLENILFSSSITDYVKNLPPNNMKLQPLTQFIIQSKSNYDKLLHNSNESVILEILGGAKIYNEKAIAELLNTIATVTVQNHLAKRDLHGYSPFNSFCDLHFFIKNMSTLSKNVFFKEDHIYDTFYDDLIVLRVLIGEENLNVSVYKKIFAILDELLDILYKLIEKEDVNRATIFLLDSGSDSNVGIKSTTEVSSSLFNLFRTVWEWIVAKKFYKNRLRNEALLDNIDVLKKIKEAEKDGVLDSNTAKIYKEQILRKTEDLLELNVIPKVLIEKDERGTNTSLLNEYKEQKLIEEKSSDS